jgi:hypothetical protein
MQTDTTNHEATTTNHEATNLANPITRGSICRIDGQRTAAVYPHLRIGSKWDGTYRAVSADGKTWECGIARNRLQML